MNLFDLVFIVLLIWSAYRGFTKGFILQLSTLAALLLGIYGAIHFSDFTARMLTEHFSISTDYLSIIAFALTFVAIVIAVHLLARLIEKLIQAIALGFINRILGIVFGIAKTAFIISIILVLVNKANDKYHFLPREKTENSLLYRPLSDFAPSIFPYLKFDELKKEFDREEPEPQKEV
ncbi:MAG: CvpA family protein [Bacteroidales bacterium]|nr:CvpA family protein [Bacteroidales bacterium]